MTAIAIDFGTSNTVVCLLDPASQTPQTLRLDRISRQFTTASGTATVIPSLVFIKEGQALLGEQVRSQRLGVAQPDRCFQSFKRDLVADFQPPPRQVDGRSYTPALISELFLKVIWQQVLQEGIAANQVILTVPVGAFERYLDWFREVASRLNFPAVQLVDESTAAALGYAVQRPGTLVLVVDFGGGTLDLSLVRTIAARSGESVLRAEVIAKADAYVGGVDIDGWIVQAYLRQQGLSRNQVGEVGWQNLLEIGERLKVRLSRETEVKESWFDDENFIAHEVSLTRSQLEEILEANQLLEQLRQALDDILMLAMGKGFSKAEVEQVLLVGGSCQIPAVQQLMLSYFGRQRVKLDKPFEAIAHGALSLAQLSGVDDYLHHSYALRLWDPYSKTHSYYALFNKGSHYPCQRKETLTLQVAIEGQREISLDIGELAEVTQAEVTYDAQGRMTSTHLNRQEAYRSLDRDHQQVCVAHLDPPGQLGVDRISVQFEVNEERILTATVRDLLTDQVLVDRGAIGRLQ